MPSCHLDSMRRLDEMHGEPVAALPFERHAGDAQKRRLVVGLAVAVEKGRRQHAQFLGALLRRVAMDMGVQMIAMVMRVIVTGPVWMVMIMVMMVIVAMVMSRDRHASFVPHPWPSTSGPAGIVTGLSMIDLCAPILPWLTSVPSTSTITRVASSAVMSDVS